MNSNRDHNPSSIKDRILHKIEHREVQMRSRTFFICKLLGVLVLALGILLLSVFIGTVLFFTLRINGHDGLLGLGIRGFVLFAQVFPWWLLILDGVLITALAWLVRSFQFGYRRPALYILFACVSIALVTGFTIDHNTSFNDRLLQDADDGGLPTPLQSVYKGTRRPPPEGAAYRGTVLLPQKDGFRMYDPDIKKELTVEFPDSDYDDRITILVGDTVFVIGDREGDIIEAFAVRKLDPRGLAPEMREPFDRDD